MFLPGNPQIKAKVGTFTISQISSYITLKSYHMKTLKLSIKESPNASISLSPTNPGSYHIYKEEVLLGYNLK